MGSLLITAVCYYHLSWVAIGDTFDLLVGGLRAAAIRMSNQLISLYSVTYTYARFCPERIRVMASQDCKNNLKAFRTIVKCNQSSIWCSIYNIVFYCEWWSK